MQRATTTHQSWVAVKERITYHNRDTYQMRGLLNYGSLSEVSDHNRDTYEIRGLLNYGSLS